jgi:hypothetical protein
MFMQQPQQLRYTGNLIRVMTELSNSLTQFLKLKQHEFILRVPVLILLKHLFLNVFHEQDNFKLIKIASSDGLTPSNAGSITITVKDNEIHTNFINIKMSFPNSQQQTVTTKCN